MSEQFCFELKGRLSFNKAIKMGTDIPAAVYTYFNQGCFREEWCMSHVS